ncbi:MAG: type II toxin-antitoxin system RelE/ParE family toxin [Candidatus Rokubacteria bacterium]|nr:type II toxin-antitoxin system RelE/ParE family toxin [Candidatus Rokubacteria bacterium]
MKGGKVTWTTEWYQTLGGEPPLKSFLEGLAGRDRDEAIAVIELLEKWGNRLRPPRSKPLGDGLFELRGDQVRIFYVFRPGSVREGCI